MERNIDKIKRLEKELGRFQKKVADQAKEVATLRKRLADAYAGSGQVQRGVDAVLAQTAITYGEATTDEESGAYLGHRMVLPEVRVDELLGRYEVRARRDEGTGSYIIGVLPREEAAEEGPEA